MMVVGILQAIYAMNILPTMIELFLFMEKIRVVRLQEILDL